MSAPVLASFEIPSADATAAIAAALAPLLGPGDVLLLDGDVGAGKTHFARALIQARQAAAGQVEDVPSPTYTLVQSYSAGPVEIWHADLYRLTGPQDVFELGLADAFEDAICLVEWPDRLESLAPETALTLHFAMTATPGKRRIACRGNAARWAPVLKAALESPGAVGAGVAGKITDGAADDV